MMLRRDEIVVDNFAGGGGASEGIEQALAALYASGAIAERRHIDIAINHDAEAVAMHAANHPATRHLCQSVWAVNPRDVVENRPVGLAWFSPDCKHFSKAKGGKPVEKNIRDLAWVVVLWARTVKPRVIMLENVEEFRDWGPLITTEDGKQMPNPATKGLTFKRWVRELKRNGYKVEHRELRACDYGAPTIRKRLFVIARRDGEPIRWPAPTHGDPKSEAVKQGALQPWRVAADCIDWSLPCPSIFMTREEARAYHKATGIRINRPLVEATMARIARGTKRYVLDAAEPFIVGLAHGESSGRREYGIGTPLTTVHAQGGNHALVTPFFAGCGGRAGQSPERPANAPFATMTAKPDGIMVAPVLVQTGYGERPGQAPRALDIQKPLGTIVSGGKHALVAAFLAQHNTDVVGHAATEPVSTIVQKGSTQAVVAAHMLNLKGSDRRDAPATEPLRALTGEGGHAALVTSFLMKYYGSGGQWQEARAPLHTVTAKDRVSVVTVTIEGETYALTDIGMRMLTPRERFRAMGFRDNYIIDLLVNGKPLSGEAQGRMCGNAVCPDLSEALFRANFGASDAAAPVEAAE